MTRGDDRSAPAVHRVVAAVLLLVVVVGLGSTTTAAAAVRQEGEQTTTTAPPDQPGIIPEPNSGKAPEDAGDRGGALQTILFVAMILGVLLIGFLVVRESRKARQRRGF